MLLLLGLRAENEGLRAEADALRAELEDVHATNANESGMAAELQGARVEAQVRLESIFPSSCDGVEFADD